MDSRDPIRDFFTFLLGAILLSKEAFLFFNQVMVSSIPVSRGVGFGAWLRAPLAGWRLQLRLRRWRLGGRLGHGR